MKQQVIVIRAGYSFQSVILDGNTVALPLFWFRNDTDLVQFPFRDMTFH